MRPERPERSSGQGRGRSMSGTDGFIARAAGLRTSLTTSLTALLLLAACGSSQSPEQASVEYKGTAPGTAAAASGGQSAPTGRAGGGDIVAYEGYQAAVARKGDTVASVADRIGLSASELGAYNGLPPDHRLRDGDELVLPPRPGGYGGQSVDESPTQYAEATSLGAPSAISGSGQTGSGQTGNDQTWSGTGGIEAAPLETAPTAGSPGDGSGGVAGWSPELAAQAIDRSDGGPTPPPSAGTPLPPDPEPAAELASPELGQYQTPGTGEAASGAAGRVPAPRPVETITTPAEQPPEAQFEAPAETAPAEPVTPAPQLATAPSAGDTLSLIRPATGPVVVGFQQGAGRLRNDGIDFASPVGSPVVAAADGEVALVSQSLGGLGTIVLLRHPGDYLTVYGRIDRVTVRKGDILQQGEQIGVVASNPQPRMHFEVRKGAESLDPARFFTGAS